jgi:post-segregation antitoxin (ccd killing protein)
MQQGMEMELDETQESENLPFLCFVFDLSTKSIRMADLNLVGLMQQGMEMELDETQESENLPFLCFVFDLSTKSIRMADLNLVGLMQQGMEMELDETQESENQMRLKKEGNRSLSTYQNAPMEYIISIVGSSPDENPARLFDLAILAGINWRGGEASSTMTNAVTMLRERLIEFICAKLGETI